MNAVNLTPAGVRRTKRPTVSVSRPFLGLVAGLVVVLLATFLFVSAHDHVTSRRSELAQLNAATARWSAAAAADARSVQTLSEQSKTVADVRALVAARYHWSVLLAEIAGRVPADAALSSLTASAPLAADPSPSDGIQISGCASAQTAVAATMDALRKVSGVSDVTLSSSTTSGTGAEGCKLPVQFQIALYFGTGGSSSSSTADPSTSSSAENRLAQ